VWSDSVTHAETIASRLNDGVRALQALKGVSDFLAGSPRRREIAFERPRFTDSRASKQFVRPTGCQPSRRDNRNDQGEQTA
jgi:hypothetical protein